MRYVIALAAVTFLSQGPQGGSFALKVESSTVVGGKFVIYDSLHLLRLPANLSESLPDTIVGAAPATYLLLRTDRGAIDIEEQTGTGRISVTVGGPHGGSMNGSGAVVIVEQQGNHLIVRGGHPRVKPPSAK